MGRRGRGVVRWGWGGGGDGGGVDVKFETTVAVLGQLETALSERN